MTDPSVSCPAPDTAETGQSGPGAVRSGPRLLDLFCCQGGAAVGYHRAGFEVVGVDNRTQPRYPYEFHKADALEFLAEHWRKFDVVHASPPCQGYLNLASVNRALGRPVEHEKLIAATRDLLESTGLPYVIENVADARCELIDPVRVCGTSFGLPLRRHRLFESNLPIVGTACDHGRFSDPKYWTGWRPNGEHRLSTVVQVYGNAGGKHEWPAAMDIQWMSYDGLAEAVPPAYTQHVGTQLIRALAVAA